MNGTTTCSYFATLHLEASKLLVDIVREQGQRAYVGKVSMDRNSPVRAYGGEGREGGREGLGLSRLELCVCMWLLVDIVREQGQRAYVGKVSMDRNSPVRALGRVGGRAGGREGGREGANRGAD